MFLPPSSWSLVYLITESVIIIALALALTRTITLTLGLTLTLTLILTLALIRKLVITRVVFPYLTLILTFTR